MRDRSSEVTAIVGAGQAGSELAMALREAQHLGRIVLIGDESHVAYRRPPLSKPFLAGQASRESLYIRPRATCERHGIECMTNARVASIDRAARKLRLASRVPMLEGGS